MARKEIISRITDVVAEYYDIPKTYATKRGGKYWMYRHQAMYLVFSFLNERGYLYKTVFKRGRKASLSMGKIAVFFNACNRSSVNFAVKKFKDRLELDPDLAKETEDIITAVYKTGDFGSRRLEISYNEKGIKFEMLFDKHGNKFYSVSTDKSSFRITDVEFETILDLKERAAFDLERNNY